MQCAQERLGGEQAGRHVCGYSLGGGGLDNHCRKAFFITEGFLLVLWAFLLYSYHALYLKGQWYKATLVANTATRLHFVI